MHYNCYANGFQFDYSFGDFHFFFLYFFSGLEVLRLRKS